MRGLGIALVATVILTAQATIPTPTERPSQAQPQTPQVEPQQRSENSVGGQPASEDRSVALENNAGKQEHGGSGEEASEIIFLGMGISLGELLLGLFTLGLWGSTQLLVREAKKSSERQLLGSG